MSISRQLFEHCMKELFGMLQSSAVATQMKLLADEVNALCYASSYVEMKLHSLHSLHSTENVSLEYPRMVKTLLSMHNDIDRGGLFTINANTFCIFKSIKQDKSRGSAQAPYSSSEICWNSHEMVQLYRRPVGVDFCRRLSYIIDMWTTKWEMLSVPNG